MNSKPLKLPITDIDLVFQACDPGKPLEPGDERYADFSALRQDSSYQLLATELKPPLGAGEFHHHCLCGHRGSGKSTEILRLKQWADEHGFLAIRTEVDEEFGMIELEFADLFLLAATTVEAEMERLGHPLPQDKISRVFRWFADVTKEDKETVKSEIQAEVEAQLGGSLPFSLGKLIAKFKAGIKAASSHAITTRQKIKNYPDTLVELTNELIHAANDLLATLTIEEGGRPRGVLLLFDNLDRYEPECINKVLYRSHELVRRMACHAVFTIPIALIYAQDFGPIQDCYGFAPVLPMLSLRHKTARWAETVETSPFEAAAITTVREALGKRIVIDTLFEHPEDADLMIKMCGGCLRDLLHMITLSYRYTSNPQRFTSQAVRRAIREMRDSYTRQLNADDYRLLAEIAHNKRIVQTEKDSRAVKEQKERLLFHRFALEYLDQAQEKEALYVDVHPLVIEIEEFRRAYNSASPIAGH